MYEEDNKVTLLNQKTKSKHTVFKVVSIIILLFVCFSTLISYLNYREKIFNKSNLNLDTNSDGIPDLNIDTNGDALCDVNCDVNDDDIADYNFDYNFNMVAMFNIDTNNDKIGDYNLINQDTNSDGICDINCDLDSDGIIDINIDVDGDKIADLNIGKVKNAKDNLFIDINNDTIPDLNIDINNDKICDINCDTDSDGIPNINIDVTEDGIADINVDINNDKKPDKNLMNVDKDKDGICDINCDTDSDGFPNLNIDIMGNGICDINCDTNGDRIADENLIKNVIEIEKINLHNGKSSYDISINSDNKLDEEVKIVSPWMTMVIAEITNSTNNHQFYSIKWSGVKNNLNENKITYHLYKNDVPYTISDTLPTNDSVVIEKLFIPSGKKVKFKLVIMFPQVNNKSVTIDSNSFLGKLKLELK